LIRARVARRRENEAKNLAKQRRNIGHRETSTRNAARKTFIEGLRWDSCRAGHYYAPAKNCDNLPYKQNLFLLDDALEED